MITYALADICLSCGRDTVDNDELCWVCKQEISECTNCDKQNTIKCLTCDNWRNMKYDTTNAGRN